MLFTKFAILWQVKILFRGTTKDSVYWLSLFLIIVDTGFYFATTIVAILLCVPREKIWNPELPGTCLDTNLVIVVTAAFNMALDILIFILPIYAIFRLRINVQRKLGISAVFAIGLLYAILIVNSV